MTYGHGGTGEQPVVIPDNIGSGPPRRVPDKPPSRWTFFRARIVKWGGISLIVFFLVLFVMMAIQGDQSLRNDDLQATAEAAEATRDALRD